MNHDPDLTAHEPQGQATLCLFRPSNPRDTADAMWQSVAIMFVAMSFIPAGDAAGKVLTSTMGISPVYVAWSRFVIGAIAIAPFLPSGTWQLLKDWRIWFRAGLLAGGITSIQTALQTETVANVFAAFFIGPIFSYVLSAIFLREPVTWLRTALILMGFYGVYTVVQPSEDMSVGLLYAVLAGLFYGTFLTASRWLSHLGKPVSLVFTQMIIAALILLPFGAANIPTLDAKTLTLTAASGLFSMLGNLLLLYAYRQTEATKLAPFVYFQLIAATLLGWFVFSEVPMQTTILGLAIILTAGITSASLRR